jgi:peptidoglycan lytic transglycosylase G
VYEGARRVLPDSSKPSANPHGRAINIVIPTGASAGDIGAILEDGGVISDGGRFREYTKEQGEGSGFKAGTYRFRAGTDYDVIIARLDAGPEAPKLVKLVIPEGLRLTEIADRVASDTSISKGSYNAAVDRSKPPSDFGSVPSMEGFLFPATYDVKARESAAALVKAQLDAFNANVGQVDMSYAASKNLTQYDVLKIASMIEREARVDEERALISAVIYNRLRLGMQLGIDATLLYEQGSWSHELTVSELEANTPYNTRVRHGLPPTPICSPGLKSLQAAAHPANVNYLYYVAKGDSGRHYFTDNIDDFHAHGG